MSETNEYTNFGNISRSRLDKQSQYGARYTDGSLNAPNLGKGLRFKGVAANYHTLLIHKDDVEEFVKRYWDYQNSLLDI